MVCSFILRENTRAHCSTKLTSNPSLLGQGSGMLGTAYPSDPLPGPISVSNQNL